MKNLKRMSVSLSMTIVMLIGSFTPIRAAVRNPLLDASVKETASYIYKTVASPEVGSVGGEWAVVGLARSGYPVPDEYYQNYYRQLESYVKAKDGNLHDKKYTEYSRIIVALTAIGKDPTSVAGYNLLTALGDYEKTIWQGLNGPIWALIALDSGAYKMPQNPKAKVQATRQMYIDRILECQLPDGGWSLLGGTPSAKLDERSDPDITGMVLQALAKYQDQAKVKKATDEALELMSSIQNDRGGYLAKGRENSESVVQIIVGLSELGISLDDPRFVKNGKTTLDNLMTFYKKENGFLHTLSGNGSSQMASEQGLYGMVASLRIIEGKNSLYRMDDVSDSIINSGPKGESGLAGKHKDILKVPVTKPGRSFDDIANNKNKEAIEALGSREIINGRAQGQFVPNDTVTRAEFAVIIINSFGLKPASNGQFKDVPKTAWYAAHVGAAYDYGIISGTSDTSFNPNGIITKQEAAAMITKAAKLAGMKTDLDDRSTRDLLAQFPDYVKSKEWARSSLAFVYKEDILDQSDIQINPSSLVSRGEIAQMVFKMLKAANLL